MRTFGAFTVVICCCISLVTAQQCYRCIHIVDEKGTTLVGNSSCSTGKPSDLVNCTSGKGFPSTFVPAPDSQSDLSSAGGGAAPPQAGCYTWLFIGNGTKHSGIYKTVMRGCYKSKPAPKFGCSTRTLSAWVADKDSYAQTVAQNGKSHGYKATFTTADACLCEGDKCNAPGKGSLLSFNFFFGLVLVVVYTM